MARHASCSENRKGALLGKVMALLLMALLSAAASAEELEKRKAPGCRTVASCQPHWCDGQCRQWGYTDPVGAYCSEGGTLIRCCCGSIGAGAAAVAAAGALSPSPWSAGVNSQQLV
ncbi:hypothetical protein GUJ93_ZPchr0011g28576 [Zizania palustris]|uniref:Uncharacterized protein n=1 Tax=Zizania palustris TaxID=103762 RepID=A0A8J6BJQ5_ZIZPA|nr:hypothetical protein GUJ93_ZPchr0011g28576 [Zizania palustris]